MKSPNKDNSVWIDVTKTFYPRLIWLDDALDWHGGFTQNDNEWAFVCVHDRDLDEPCVACEGLSILENVRR